MDAGVASKNDTAMVHALLLQVPVDSETMALTMSQQVEALLKEGVLPFGIRLLRVVYHIDVGCYAYLGWDAPVALNYAAVAQAQLQLQQGRVLNERLGMCRLSRLHHVMERFGPAAGESPVVHYVVEMDPEAGWENELFRWYDEEHLPGLAAVEGTISADRFLNLDHGPRSLACYDLIDQSVMGGPAWLAVRATAWSSQVRPHFTNTKRTMFSCVL